MKHECLICGSEFARPSFVIDEYLCFECWNALEEYRNMSDEDVQKFLVSTLSGVSEVN